MNGHSFSGLCIKLAFANLDAARVEVIRLRADLAAAAKTIARLRMDYDASQAALSDCLTEHRVLVERVEALCAEADRERTTWVKGKESKPWHIGYVDVRHIREALDV